MTRAFAILTALRSLTIAAVPAADVRGFTEDVSMPDRVAAGGTIQAESGDPGTPEYDLSPIAYTYTHTIPVAAMLPATAGDQALADLIAPIGTAVAANRALGGLCNWLDVTAPVFTSEDAPGTVPLRVASFEFIAEYTISNPLAG